MQNIALFTFNLKYFYTSKVLFILLVDQIYQERIKDFVHQFSVLVTVRSGTLAPAPEALLHVHRSAVVD